MASTTTHKAPAGLKAGPPECPDQEIYLALMDQQASSAMAQLATSPQATSPLAAQPATARAANLAAPSSSTNTIYAG